MAALDHAARHGVLVVAAAGNDPTTTGSSLTCHPWAIPVAACDDRGQPMPNSTIGASIGRRGIAAPGSLVLRPGPGETWLPFGGTSAAAPLVTGTIALLWALFPDAPAAEIRWAVTAAPPITDGGLASAPRQAALRTVTQPRNGWTALRPATTPDRPNGPDPRNPHRVRLPGFISDDVVGLGDAVKRVNRAFGVRPAAAASDEPPPSTSGCASRE